MCFCRNVITQIGKMGMLQYTVYDSIMVIFIRTALAVVNLGIPEINMIRTQYDRVVLNVVGYICYANLKISFIDEHVTFQVDGFERTEYSGPSGCSSPKF